MAEKHQSRNSIHQCIYAILGDNHNHKSFTPPPLQAEEAEELEYLLARAERELLAVKARVDHLRHQLATRRGPLRRPA